MAKVRKRFWVPKPRKLVKQLRNKCYGCKRFRAEANSMPLNSRSRALPSIRNGIHRLNPIPGGSESGEKGIFGALQVQSNLIGSPEVIEIARSGRVSTQTQETNCTQRSARADIFGQRHNVQGCRQEIKTSTMRRTAQRVYRTIGYGTLSWGELEDVVLNIEVPLNNHPLS